MQKPLVNFSDIYFVLIEYTCMFYKYHTAEIFDSYDFKI